MIRKIVKANNANNNDMNNPKGMYWNGFRYVKAKPGAYDGTEMYQQGGYIENPYIAGRPHLMHGGNIEVPYTGGRPRLAYGGMLKGIGGPDYTHVTALMRDGGQIGRDIGNPNYTHVTAMMADGGIHIKPENKGKFTSWAQNRGMGVQEAASRVMSNKENYSLAVVKMANFARNFGGKKRMGGYADGGPYDEDNGVQLPSAGNPWGSSAANTSQQMQDVYAPVAQANQQAIPIAANQMRAPISPERANMDETPVEGAENLNNPYAQGNQTPAQQTPPATPPTQPRRPFGTGYRDLLGAAMIYGQGAADRRQAKSMQAYGIKQGMTGMTPASNPWGKGQYNQQGQLAAVNQPVGHYKMGGNMNQMPKYAVGGVYELTDDEIQKMKMGGYKLKMC